MELIENPSYADIGLGRRLSGMGVSPMMGSPCHIDRQPPGNAPARGLGANAFDRESNRALFSQVNVDDIRKRLEQGFVPFKIRTSDGSEFKVPHREFIMVTQRRVVVADRKGYVNVLDPLHIVSIEEGKALPAG